jgi:6,7-dimethyl-8-ribityllumazine synthase
MPKVAIVAAQFNKPLVDAMVAAARAEAETHGVEIVREVRVTGCYELPLVVARLLPKKKLDGIVVLGYIERGETLHGEVMGHVVHRALLELALAHDKPIGLGIVGPGATPAQAEVRKENSARAAGRAVITSVEVLASLQ